ncbi:MAG: structural protein, partial [Pseudomonadota bacterium]
MPRGIRNHNPGNIRHGDDWQGLRDTQTDKNFCQFVSPEFGIRALARVLMNYEKKHGL